MLVFFLILCQHRGITIQLILWETQERFPVCPLAIDQLCSSEGTLSASLCFTQTTGPGSGLHAINFLGHIPQHLSFMQQKYFGCFRIMNI